MTEILTLTMNPALDIATATDVIEPSRKLRCDMPRYDPGGGGINVARAAHMLGGDALAVFPAGGASGQMIESLPREEGSLPRRCASASRRGRRPCCARAPSCAAARIPSVSIANSPRHNGAADVRAAAKLRGIDVCCQAAGLTSIFAIAAALIQLKAS
jgi:hypothetical protein